MNFTLHLTNDCNLNCSYCYNSKVKEKTYMNVITARNAVDLAIKSFGQGFTFVFFGGEPLLNKDIIYYIIDYYNHRQKTENLQTNASFKISTNGYLLDEEFISYASNNNISIALSIDGDKEVHDKHRKNKSGIGTFDKISQIIYPLLSAQPYSAALLVVNQDTVRDYCQSVKYLVKRGFRYIIPSINYFSDWTKKDLKELKKQYHLLADYYKELTINEKKFYLSTFETKFTSHIKGKKIICTDCVLSYKQISIAPNGDVYPCVQFVHSDRADEDFVIGNVFEGINDEKRRELFLRSEEPNTFCNNCSFDERCSHKCACLNWGLTKQFNLPGSIVCETEQILIPIVDKLGEELFKMKAPHFIQKHYNTVYPVLSLMEDKHLSR